MRTSFVGPRDHIQWARLFMPSAAAGRGRSAQFDSLSTAGLGAADGGATGAQVDRVHVDRAVHDVAGAALRQLTGFRDFRGECHGQ